MSARLHWRQVWPVHNLQCCPRDESLPHRLADPNSKTCTSATCCESSLSLPPKPFDRSIGCIHEGPPLGSPPRRLWQRASQIDSNRPHSPGPFGSFTRTLYHTSTRRGRARSYSLPFHDITKLRRPRAQGSVLDPPAEPITIRPETSLSVSRFPELDGRPGDDSFFSVDLSGDESVSQRRTSPREPQGGAAEPEARSRAAAAQQARSEQARSEGVGRREAARRAAPGGSERGGGTRRRAGSVRPVVRAEPRQRRAG